MTGLVPHAETEIRVLVVGRLVTGVEAVQLPKEASLDRKQGTRTVVDLARIGKQRVIGILVAA